MASGSRCGDFQSPIPIGLIGVLRVAKHKHLIPAIKPYLDALRDLAGFRISDVLYQRVLRDEGEM